MLGNNLVSLLAHAMQESDKIWAMFSSWHKQAQEHYDHLPIANRDCSGAAKSKCYQKLQEALREATRDYDRQQQAFDCGFFSSLSPEVRGDFEKVLRERTMEREWSEIQASLASEEHMYYPVHKRMRADYVKAAERRCIPDTTNQATRSEDAQLRLAPLHLVDPRMGPAARTDVLTQRDIAALALWT